MQFRVTVAVLLLTACVPFVRRTPPPDPVQVDSIDASFTAEDRAQFALHFSVENPERKAGGVIGIEWELYLRGRWFAAGAQQLAATLPSSGGKLTVNLPLVFPKTPLLTGPIPLEVGVRGRLSAQIEGSQEWLPFHQTLTVVSDGAPALNPIEEE